MGLPLQLFCQGMFFGPYTPLQQIDMLEHEQTKGYLIGTTNSLFLQRKERHADILVNVFFPSATIPELLDSELTLLSRLTMELWKP